VPTFTVQQIIDRAKAAADMHDDFVTDAQWMAWLNVEVPALESYLARAGYVLRESVFTYTADSLGFAQVPSVLAIVGVYRSDQGRLVRLRAADIQTRMRQYNGLGSVPDTGDATEFFATPVGDDVALYLYPRPAAGSGTYYVWYIPAPATLANVAGTVSYPLGWEERLVLRLARRALAKEETGTSALDSQLAEVDRQIDEMVWSRLLAQTPAVRNVDRVERAEMGFGRWPAVSEWFFP